MDCFFLGENLQKTPLVFFPNQSLEDPVARGVRNENMPLWQLNSWLLKIAHLSISFVD